MNTPDLGGWTPLLQKTLAAPFFAALQARVAQAREAGPVYPPEEQVYNAFLLTPPEAVRAVILGQDPYHGPGQANGLAFSVSPGTRLPPSLRNIFQELKDAAGAPLPKSGDLTPWAKQGVFLLNTVLTVSDGQANSHSRFGWQRFTDAVLDALAPLPQPIAVVLWGAQAQKKAAAVAASPHPRLILQAPHPSPLSAYRGFFGSDPFGKINGFLCAQGCAPIDWALPE